jgi:P4 family phage/plasmid primase-like protien
MRQSLEDEDIYFLQEWFGLALLGKNVAHAILILVGTAGSGKSTFVRILTEIVGKSNVYTLRTDRLGEKFETSFYLGKTLLHGVDVASDFLSHKNASVLKALTGGDIMNVELKNGREGGPEIEGYFNVVIICNALPNIRFEGDSGAWKRRLLLVQYQKPKPNTVITTLADMILKDEGAGVLNWALDGLKKLRENKWCFKLTTNQSELVDKVLLQSDSPRQFVRRCLVEEKDCLLTQDDCSGSYVLFCKGIGWLPLASTKACPIIEEEIMRQFGLNRRNDIKGSNGKDQRGWKGIKVK